MWYFNSYNFSKAQEMEFKEILAHEIIEKCSEYEVMFSEGEYESGNDLFNGYEFLADSENIIKTYKFETGNWIFYKSKLTDKIKKLLKEHLKDNFIFHISFLLNGEKLFEINDFNEYLIHDFKTYTLFENFKDLIEKATE